jgi:hypothetical protein
MAHNDTDGITPNVVVGEGVWIIDGGVGGFESGHEGGNSKWFGTVDLRIKGALFDFGGHPHKDGQGPLWLDINDDGYHIFGNIVRDLDHGGKRGLFVETCYSGKIYDNICYELGWAGESDFWGNGIIISTAGPDLANSEYLTIEIHHNLLYHCAGGVHLVGNRDTSPEFWHRWGFPYVHDIDVHHNTTVFAGSAFAGWTEPVGVTVADQFGTVENCFYENNVYLVDADSGRFTDEQDGGGGNGMDFNDWQTTGVTQDTTGDLVVAGGYDADPFNGGAM